MYVGQEHWQRALTIFFFVKNGGFTRTLCIIIDYRLDNVLFFVRNEFEKLTSEQSDRSVGFITTLIMLFFVSQYFVDFI